MWKFLMTVGLLFSLCTMAGCDVREMGSLQDLSKPYVGVYECDRLLLGGQDALRDFAYLRLELGYGGDFRFSYETLSGGKSEWEGTYTVDLSKEEIAMTAKSPAGTLSRTFRMENGSVLFDGNFAGRSFFASFVMG